MITRRGFLRRILGSGALLGIGYVSYKTGWSGCRETLRSIGNSIFPNDKPKNKLLFDQHFHLGHFKKEKDLESIVHRFLKKNDFVTISLHGLKPNDNDSSYEEFIKGIKRLKSVEILFSDKFATTIKKGKRKTTFFRGQEVHCYNPWKKKHELHINVVGQEDYVKDYKTGEYIIHKALKENAMITLNHPYAVQNKHIRYWFPDDKETAYIEFLARKHNIMIEEFNMMSILWMAASNTKAQDLRKRTNRIGVGGTDAHPANAYYTKKMIGHCGTLLDKSKILEDMRSFSGKEMIHAFKEHLKTTNIEILDNYISPFVFYKVMMQYK